MLSLFVCLLLGSFAQFEVASIKPSSAEEGHSSWNSRHGNLDMRNMSLKAIILAAYGIKEHQYSGPDWLEKERFNISAKAPGVTSDEEMRPLMQSLLAELPGQSRSQRRKQPGDHSQHALPQQGLQQLSHHHL
jgi:hypothetical protein